METSPTLGRALPGYHISKIGSFVRMRPFLLTLDTIDILCLIY